VLCAGASFEDDAQQGSSGGVTSQSNYPAVGRWIFRVVDVGFSEWWTLNFPSGGRWIFRVVDVGFSEWWTLDFPSGGRWIFRVVDVFSVAHAFCTFGLHPLKNIRRISVNKTEGRYVTPCSFPNIQ